MTVIKADEIEDGKGKARDMGKVWDGNKKAWGWRKCVWDGDMGESGVGLQSSEQLDLEQSKFIIIIITIVVVGGVV